MIDACPEDHLEKGSKVEDEEKQAIGDALARGINQSRPHNQRFFMKDHLRRFERVLRRKIDVEEVYAVLVGRSGRAHNGRYPFVQVIAFWSCAAVARRVQADLRKFFLYSVSESESEDKVRKPGLKVSKVFHSCALWQMKFRSQNAKLPGKRRRGTIRTRSPLAAKST